MLLKFRIKNYKSYKELQEFSMISGNTKLYEERLQKESGFSVLKFSAIYGANASGKTTLIDALADMQRILIIGLPNFIRPIYYRLDEQLKNIPSYFEVLLLINGKEFSYGFEYDSNINKLSSEWLVEIKEKKEKEIYSRDMKKGCYYYDQAYNKKTDGKLSIYLEDLKEEDSKLFLYIINDAKRSSFIGKNSELRDVYEWFYKSLSITEPNSILTSGEYFLVEEKIKKLASLLKAFDTGIRSIGTVNVDNEMAMQNIPAKIIEKLQSQAFQEMQTGTKGKMGMLVRTKTNLWNISMQNQEMQCKKICFFHDEQNKIPFSIIDESEGTIRVIDLAETLLTEKENQLFVIDELDRKLHPQLTCKFVQLFLEHAKKSSNQLIVTTHESRLLDFSLLRRDEIWFANKNNNGESKLYSLEEFNVRFDKKIDRAYLDGRYGGIPIFDAVFPSVKKCQE